MSASMPERDWKVFRRVHEAAMHRYFQKLLDQAIADAQDIGRPLKERYNEFYEAVRKRDRILRDVFDDYRRSTALFQLPAMHRLGLITMEELSEFTPETQAFVLRYLDPM